MAREGWTPSILRELKMTAGEMRFERGKSEASRLSGHQEDQS